MTEITYKQLENGRYEVTFVQHNTAGFMGVTRWSYYFDSLSELKFKYPTAQPKK